jgi:hypothetical protein
LKYFLRMKAWMIFSFVTLLYIISILSFYLHSIFELFYIILLLEITFITGWFYSLAKFYYSRIPRFKGLNLMLLKMYYSIYFISKSSVSFTSGTEATFERYIKTFFLLWFFPVGVWFIQPQVNKLAKADFHGVEKL